MDLKELRTKIIEMEVQQKRCDNLKTSLSQLKIGLEASRQILEKENLDVEKLEGKSFKAIMETILGRYDETLKKEQEEALNAKMKYDRIVNEKNRMEREIDKLELDLKDYDSINEKYQQELENVKINYGDSEVYKDYNNRLREYRREHREIQEAITANKNAQKSVDLVLESLMSAKDWGTFDVLGGGLIATAEKYSKMDEAKERMNNVSYYLKTLNRELQDIGKEIEIELEIDGFLKVADYFFDGLIVDMSVQSRIKEACNKVDVGKVKLEQLSSKLNSLKLKNEENYNSLEREFEDVLVEISS